MRGLPKKSITRNLHNILIGEKEDSYLYSVVSILRSSSSETPDSSNHTLLPLDLLQSDFYPLSLHLFVCSILFNFVVSTEKGNINPSRCTLLSGAIMRSVFASTDGAITLAVPHHPPPPPQLNETSCERNYACNTLSS